MKDQVKSHAINHPINRAQGPAVCRALLGWAATFAVVIAAYLLAEAVGVHPPASVPLTWAALVLAVGPSPVPWRPWCVCAVVPMVVWGTAAVLGSTPGWAAATVICATCVLEITRRREHARVSGKERAS